MKKFLRYIFTIALFGAICFGGYKYITDWGKPEEVNIAALENAITMEEDDYIGRYPFKYNSYICDGVIELFNDALSSGNKYLISKNYSEDENYIDVYKSDEKQVESLITNCNAKTSFEGTPNGAKLSDVSEWEKYSKYAIEGLESTKYTSYFHYVPIFTSDYNCNAFGTSLYNKDYENGVQGCISTALKDNGLDLEIENPEVVAMYFNEWMLCNESYSSYVLVKADVKCIRNLGTYINTSWIPANGQIDTIFFIVKMSLMYSKLSETKIFPTVYNIAVLE